MTSYGTAARKAQYRGVVSNQAVPMDFTIEYEQESDNRWLAEVPELPGVLAYGASSDEALRKAEVLALRVWAERSEQKETGPVANRIGCPEDL